jgi:hypothetical protein
LPSVRLRRTDELGDLAVAVAERLAQHVRRTLGRGEAFEQHQQGHRHRLPLGDHLERAQVVQPRAGQDRLGQPLADVRLATSASGRQLSEAEVRDGPGQVGRRVVHPGAISGLPAEPGFLQHFLGVGGRAEDPVRDAEHPASLLLERLQYVGID